MKMSTMRTTAPIMAARSEGSMKGKRPKNPSWEKVAGYRTAGFAKYPAKQPIYNSLHWWLVTMRTSSTKMPRKIRPRLSLRFYLFRLLCNKMGIELNFFFFFKVFGGHMSFLGATGTPVLDFLWHLLWVSKPEWVLPYSLFLRRWM